MPVEIQSKPWIKNLGKKLCLYCGKEFKLRRSTQEYCGNECVRASKRCKKSCLICRKEFTVIKSVVNTIKFCSKECRFKHGNEKKVCPQCTKEFTARRCLKQKYCSDKCN